MQTILDELDPRLRDELRAELGRLSQRYNDPLPRGLTVVLAGHRAAGKTRVLPSVAKFLGREALDLDQEVERRAGRSLRAWFEADPASFRRAEREVFQSLPAGLVVSVGGGFLSNHADLLKPGGCVVVEVPVSFETFAERLRADTSRPRLRPELTLEQELRAMWDEREVKHRQFRPLSFVEFLSRAGRGVRARRVVTLPPGVSAVDFAWQARHQGADLLEVRTDLIDTSVDLRPVARALPLLVAERERAVPDEWKALAALVDQPLETGATGPFLSFHAPTPLTTAQAIAAWERVPHGTLVKHIEPLGELSDAPRLFETRRVLAEKFGNEMVTVLPTGPLAVPFRALLANENALDYLRMNDAWQAAPGQRLLADAVRAARSDSERRLGILGSALAHSRSPRIHRPPFDRLELPADTELSALLEVLRPYYVGFAVTAPFKQRAAAAVKAGRDAVNTLARSATGWTAMNTDVAGAAMVLDVLGAKQVTVLGEGGVGDALREAAADVTLTFVKRSDVVGRHYSGAVVWTWPAHVEPPTFDLTGARVAVIAYGAPARLIAQRIRERGGEPIRLGPRWFIAQARMQRALWGPA